MTDEITTVIGQLHIVGEKWQNDMANQVAVREPKAANSPGAGKGDLFVLTEVLGSGTDLDILEQKLAETIRDAYYLARGSATASLRRALQTANELLYQRNSQLPVEERVVGGAVVVVMSQENMFAVQVGPAALFAVSNHHIERYPAKTAWLDDIEAHPAEKDDPVLGVTPLVEPNLCHLEVTPLDVLVLADSDLVSQISPQNIAKAVSNQNIKTAVKNLGKAANNHDCSALVLTVAGEVPSRFSALKTPVTEQLSKFLPSKEPTTVANLPSASESVEIPSYREASPISTAVTSVSPLQKTTDWLKSKWNSQPESEPAMAEPTPHQDESTTTTGSIWHSIWVGLLMAMAFLATGLRSLFGAVSGQGARQAGSQANSNVSHPIPWRALAVIAVAIPLFVAAFMGISYVRTSQLQETTYTNLVANARAKFEQTKTITNSNVAMGLIAEAEKSLGEAEKIKTNQPEIAELRMQMAAQADKIGKVQRFYYLPQLRQYTDNGTNLKAILVQGIDVYVLDSGTNRVFHHRLNNLGEGLLPDNETVLLVQQGQVVNDITVNKLLGMVWMPSGGNRQTSDLLILSNTGLLEYNPNWGVTTTPLANNAQLVKPVSADSFFGNFYLLDPAAGKLLRYVPTTQGYGAPPESYFPIDQLVDLSQAVDFGIDGAVYVLFQDGRMNKFASGRPVTFNLNGLDKPLKNPTALFTAPDEVVQYIYVADAGNQRIVQLNKDGSFVRQFKPRDKEAVTFANLQDVFVDEIGGRIYILDSNNLYMGNIPNQ